MFLSKNQVKMMVFVTLLAWSLAGSAWSLAWLSGVVIFRSLGHSVVTGPLYFPGYFVLIWPMVLGPKSD
jgi:predicted small lipoprotein YifL